VVKLGLDSFSYHIHLEDQDNPRDAFWLIEKTLELGLNGCSFNPRHLRGWDEEFIRSIGRFCREKGLYFELGGGGSDFSRLSKRIRLASEVGASIMHTFISCERYKVPDQQRRHLIASTIENIQRLADVAECFGVTLALGNHEDLTSEEIADILDAIDSPYIKACVCNAHAMSVWEDPLEAVRTLLPYLATVRLKDWKHYWQEGIPIREGCPMGQGNARVAEVYALLRKSVPHIPILLEIPTMGPGHVVYSLEEEERNVLSSLHYIRSLEPIQQGAS